MDWSLFWSAFGAIGTTAGTFITAIAVVVSLRQYKLPLNKKIKLNFSGLFFQFEEESEPLCALKISNIGIRPITINGVYVKGKYYRGIFLKELRVHLERINPANEDIFPIKLDQEESITFYVKKDDFHKSIQNVCVNSHIRRFSRICFVVKDSTEELIYIKSKFRYNRYIQ